MIATQGAVTTDTRGRIDDVAPEDILPPVAGASSDSGSSISEEDEPDVLENRLPVAEDLQALRLEDASDSDDEDDEEGDDDDVEYDDEDEEWDPEDEDWDLLQGGELSHTSTWRLTQALIRRLYQAVQPHATAARRERVQSAGGRSGTEPAPSSAILYIIQHSSGTAGTGRRRQPKAAGGEARQGQE